MRIAVFEIEKWEKEYLEKSLAGHQLSFHEEPLTEENVALAADADIAVVFIYSCLNAAVLMGCPKLKMVTTRSMGFDHIDLNACATRGITVCRVPAYGEQTVAEHAFALIMSLSRHIFQAYERTEKAVFDYHGLMGFDLMDKTIGVVGGGRIGLNVVRIAHAFGMKVIVHDPYPKPELAVQYGFTYAALDEVLAQADVVTLHVPYMPATHHLMNDATFAKMKPGAILVNTARGGLVDTGALLKALESGQLAGAGLDVIEEEGCFKEEAELATGKYQGQCDLQSIIRNHALINRSDVIITPHIAWYSREAVERILGTTAENVIKFAGGAPVNVVQTK
jgi:D-lactate dehydrogenase